jgi:CheY-like chemotaxis protein
MEKALREADRRKDEFLATLAHELRNPLAPIVSGLELLRLQPEDSATAGKVLPTLERQTSHLVRLVDDLLEVSRITRGKIELRRRRVDLASVIAGAVETSRPLLDRAGHRLEVELPPEPLHLDADPVRLGQVFANLLNNAARYTPEGGDVRLRVEGGAGEAVVTIRDSGVGFEPERGDSLFELFAQGGDAPAGRSGLGIGLTLVRSLVELHGGSVTAASEGPGRGSVFTVRLPLDARDGGARPDAEAKTPPAAEAESSTTAGVRGGLRVLIADDNRDAADALRELLEALGHRARAVYGGEEALAACEEAVPDVALLDLGMPGVDGYEAARRLRLRGERPVLIALTGWGQAADRRRTREAGFDHHLVKPATLTALRELLDAIGAQPAAGEPAEAPGDPAGGSG